MNQYPRTPALVILIVAAVLGVAYVAAWGKIERYLKGTAGDQSIELIEQKIAKGDHTAPTWFAYAQALSDAHQYSKAADAYREVLTLEPKREAKFGCGVSLALANRADDFYNFQKDMVYSEAKLAVELFERPETQKYLSEDRFAALAKEAKNQAMD